MKPKSIMELAGLAVAVCGLSLTEFLLLNPREFAPILRVAMENVNRQNQTAYEIARFNAWIGVRPHLKKGGPPNPVSLVKFPWEREQQKVEVISPSKIDWKAFKL